VHSKETNTKSPNAMPQAGTIRHWIGLSVNVALILLIICTLLAYLTAAFSAFTSFKFTLTDYGRYVNTIWNCAHGHPFRLLTEYSYLNTHLSFSLFLLAPAFLIWDHPFSLWVGQWLLTIIGLCIIWKAAFRHRIPGVVTLAFLIFYLANPFTQCVLLSEFHGVNLYLFLIPWLYYCLAFQRKMTWLPLILIWGVREEAAFLVVPILLYFAIKEHWKWGYIYTVFSGLYGLLACTVLFQWINGSSLRKLRPGMDANGIIKSISRTLPSKRFFPFLRLTAPTIPFFKKGWVPICTFPAVALLFTVFSPYPAQYTLKYHYPAAPLILMVVGMLQGIALYWQQQPKHPEWSKWFQAIFLVTVVALLHFFDGLLPLGHFNTGDYQHPSSRGRSALCAISNLPKQGLLLSDRRMGGMCANRQDLIIWEQYGAKDLQPEVIFTELKDVARKHVKILQSALTDGSFGVSFFDGTHIIMRKGYPTSANKSVLTAVDNASRTIFFAYTKKKGGTEIVSENCEIVRYWSGKQQGKKTLIAYGKTITLAPGDYLAVFSLKAELTDPQENNNGILRVVERKTQAPLVRAGVQLSPSEDGIFLKQDLSFHLDHTTQVEPQVLGENSRLWLDRVVFQQQSPSPQEKTGFTMIRTTQIAEKL